MKKIFIDKIDGIIDEYKFIVYIKGEMQSYIEHSIISNRLVPFDQYFADNEDIFSENNKILSAKQIVLLGSQNFVIKEFPERYEIFIDKNKVMPNFNQFKIYDLCCLINDGNLELQPYPIFNECVNYINQHINDLYYVWEES